MRGNLLDVNFFAGVDIAHDESNARGWSDGSSVLEMKSSQSTRFRLGTQPSAGGEGVQQKRHPPCHQSRTSGRGLAVARPVRTICDHHIRSRWGRGDRREEEKRSRGWDRRRTGQGCGPLREEGAVAADGPFPVL